MHVSRNVQTTECILVSVSLMFLVVYLRAAKPMHGNRYMRSAWWPKADKTIACEALCEPALLKPLFLKLRRLNRLSELTPAVVSYI